MTTNLFYSLFLFLIPQETYPTQPPRSTSLSASEWMEGILAPTGPASRQEMDCLASDNPLDPAAEFVQVLFKRTWPRNLVRILEDQFNCCG